MRILIVDEHELASRAIRAVIETAPTLEVCGEASDTAGAIDKVTALRPDVLIISVNLSVNSSVNSGINSNVSTKVTPGVSTRAFSGLQATTELKRLFPQTEIVIIGQHDSPEMVQQALRAGARGYLVRSAISTDLLPAIEKAGRHETFSPSGQSTPVSARLTTQPAVQLAQQPAALQPGVQTSARTPKAADTPFELALRESEELFRSVMNNMAEGLFTFGAQGQLTYINPSAEKMLDWTAAELSGKNIHDVMHYARPDGTPFPASECPALRVIESGIEIRENEDFFIRKDGSFFAVVFSASPLRNDGSVTGAVVSFRDDTKRREAADALRHSEQLYRAIGESIDYGVWICDAEGRNTYASPSFLTLVNLSQEQCSEFGWAHVVHPDDIAGLITAWRECVGAGALWEREFRVRGRDGMYHYISGRGIPIRGDGEKVLCWAGINLDIQNLKTVEVELRNSASELQRLVHTLEERVDERTHELLNARNELQALSRRLLKTQDEERRRIARELHDGIGQLLAAMNMNLSMLVPERSALSANAAKSLDENISLVDQASQDIRTVSHLLHPPLLDEVGLTSALQWFLDGFAHRSKIAVTLHVAPDLPKLSRDLELSLFRIVQECLTNIHRHSGSLTAHVRLYAHGTEVRLEVRDEGRGIPADIQAKISSGESFGVGLRGIRERVRQFGGHIDLQSDATGTAVVAVLPYDGTEDVPSSTARETGSAKDLAPEPATPDMQTVMDPAEDVTTILCIDDEETGLLPRRLLLESAGHRVFEARSGPEGLRLFQSEKIDAVVLDYWMSGMKGTVVAAELRRLSPSVPIIMLSGLGDFPGEMMGVVDEWLLKGSNRAEHLLDTIKKLLERRPV